MKVDFDEFIHIANLSKSRMAKWNTKSLTLFKVVWNIRVCAKWIYFVKKQFILELCFAIPGTSATIEKVLSTSSALWANEKKPFLFDTTK
jgi:hypothetical protein